MMVFSLAFMMKTLGVRVLFLLLLTLSQMFLGSPVMHAGPQVARILSILVNVKDRLVQARLAR